MNDKLPDLSEEDRVFILQAKSLAERLRASGRHHEGDALRYAMGLAIATITAEEGHLDAELYAESLNRLRGAVASLYQQLPDLPQSGPAGLN